MDYLNEFVIWFDELKCDRLIWIDTVKSAAINLIKPYEISKWINNCRSNYDGMTWNQVNYIELYSYA